MAKSAKVCRGAKWIVNPLASEDDFYNARYKLFVYITCTLVMRFLFFISVFHSCVYRRGTTGCRREYSGTLQKYHKSLNYTILLNWIIIKIVNIITSSIVYIHECKKKKLQGYRSFFARCSYSHLGCLQYITLKQ